MSGAISSGEPILAAITELQLSKREYRVVLGVWRLTHGLGFKSARLTQVQILQASGLTGKDVNLVLAELDKKRILHYEEGPEGTRYWLNPRPEEWRASPILTRRLWANLVSQVEAVETATQRKLDLYTEQPSFRSTVVEITGSAEELHSREPERGGREKLPVGPGSRIPLPASASDRLREQVKRFVGERDYDHYWGRTQSNHFFTPPLAGILEAELRFCSSGILHHETVVRKSRGQMLFWYFKRAAVQAGYRLIDGKPVETAMPMPGGYRAEGTPENRACPGK